MKTPVAIGLVLAVASMIACCFPARQQEKPVAPVIAQPKQEEQKPVGDQAKKLEKKEDVPLKIDEEKVTQIDAGDLISIYKDNEVKANELYKGKRLEVKGYVYRVTNKAVELKGKDARGLLRIQAIITPDDNSKVGGFVKGQVVIVVGICEGKKVDVQLKDCKFSEAP